MIKKDILGSLLMYLTARRNTYYVEHMKKNLKWIGEDVKCEYPFKIINPDCVTIGNNVVISSGSNIMAIKKYNTQDFKPAISIGSGSYIGRYAHIVAASYIDIGKKVLIADKVYISDNQHSYRDVKIQIMDQDISVPGNIVIEDDVWIGENVCIFGSVRIGRHSVIGANSVVTRNIPELSVYAGNPGRIIKRYDVRSSSWSAAI